MQADDPQWWSGYCEALGGIDYQSPAWTMALVSGLTQATDDERRHSSGRGHRNNDTGRDSRRRSAVPDSIRRLTPINRKGLEPCLLNVAGLPCNCGSRDRCGNPRHMHNWTEPLPARVKEWVDETYRGRAATEVDRR